MSDDDFIDVAATVAGVSSSSPSVHGGGGFGDGNDALRALSGRLGGDDEGGAMPSASASTSSQHHQSPPSASAPPHHRSRRGWFSSLFGGGGALPSAVHAARFKTVIDRPDLSVTYASNFPDRLRLIKTVHLFPLQVKLKADYVRSIRDLQVGCSVKDSILGGSLRLDAASRTLCYHKRLPLASLLNGGGGGVPSLPAGFSAGGALGIFAGMSYDGLLPVGSRGDAGEAMSLGGGPARPRPPALSMESLRPFLTFRYELGGGGYGGGGTGAVWNGDGLALRHRFRVTKGLGLEVRGSARLPTPRAEVTLGGGGGGGYGYGYAGGGGGRGGGRGGPAAEGRLSLGEGGAHLHVEEVNLVFHL